MGGGETEREREKWEELNKNFKSDRVRGKKWN